MKKIFLIIFTLIITITFQNSYSQLANQNMYLLRNLNEHFTSTLYSAVWGYKAPNGREYALLGCPTGTAFIDVTDSANIREVDFLTGLTSSWREMKTYSHYAYIVSEATNSRLQIVDLQYLPDSVSLVKTWNYPTYDHTHSISQSGPYLYLNGGNATSNGGISVLDITDPINPVKKGQWITLYVHDCRVVDDTIYAANIFNDKVSIINAVNKDSLKTITTFTNLPGGGPHNTALSQNGKRLFVTDEIGTAPYRLKVWNIENKTSVAYVTSWQPTGITTSIIHNIETYGNFGIIAHYTAGVRIINISNPDNPTEVAWYDTYPSNNGESYDGCWGVYLFPSGKIIASDRQTGLYVLKTNFPLTGVNNIVTNSIPENFSLSQNYPNPFNPSTKIMFSLPKNSNISLKIYNTGGKEVANVIDDRRDAGNYEITFDAADYGLSSGTYFYKLNSDNFSETKKMLLVK
ncbi:MAG: choice-of-anchor B family protein [Ignavibacteria bacterium]